MILSINGEPPFLPLAPGMTLPGIATKEGARFVAALAAAKRLEEESRQPATKGNAGARSTKNPRPPARLIRTANDAELVAAEWMRYMGFDDAAATSVGTDEGIDVASREAVAQVKMEGVPTGRPAVQGLFGVAAMEGKKGLFFSLAGYTAEAIAWGTKAGVVMFTFDLQGQPVPLNNAAKTLLP